MIDERDYQILEILVDNARASHRYIKQQTGIPTMTVSHKIKRMEEQGIIKRYSAKIDHAKIGMNLVAYMLIKTNYPHVQQKKTTQVEIAKKLVKYPFISCISTVTGRSDILLRVRAKDMNQLNKFATKIAQIEGIHNTETLIVLKDVTRTASTHKELIRLMHDETFEKNLLG